jgi:riboflavin kinase/FMN adenylyltransferase
VALTIGKFDGVHEGHRHLADHVIREAVRRGVLSAALVLHPQPRTVLFGEPVPLLTTPRTRCRRLRAHGIDIVEPLQFSPEVAHMAPAAFIDRVATRFELAAVVIGPDFAFGRDRTGDLATLRSLGAERGFDTVAVPPLVVDGEHVSSRLVRGLVERGDIDVARGLMRSPPRVAGTVVRGAARGRQLGFPTANLDLAHNFVVPANGVYTVRARWNGPPSDGHAWIDGLASIGVRPTFDNGARIVEVFLLGFSGDLYGRRMTVEFLARQRPEWRFETVEGLIEQMNVDVAVARRQLADERARSANTSS